MTCSTCRDLLSAGLDLCVRARKLEAQDRANAALECSVDGDEWESSGQFERYAIRNNYLNPDRPMSLSSGTIPLWVEDQYQADLSAWEDAARQHLTRGCTQEREA